MNTQAIIQVRTLSGVLLVNKKKCRQPFVTQYSTVHAYQAASCRSPRRYKNHCQYQSVRHRCLRGWWSHRLHKTVWRYFSAVGRRLHGRADISAEMYEECSSCGSCCCRILSVNAEQRRAVCSMTYARRYITPDSGRRPRHNHVQSETSHYIIVNVKIGDQTRRLFKHVQ